MNQGHTKLRFFGKIPAQNLYFCEGVAYKWFRKRMKNAASIFRKA